MKRLTTLLMVLAALVLGGCGFGTVHPGERAVFARFGRLDVWPGCFKEGFYAYNPFTTDMWTLDVKVQKLTVDKTGAASKDLQDIYVDAIVNFAIDGDHCNDLISEVGVDFKDRVVVPAVHETIKASTAHFPIEKVIQERAKLKEEIVVGLKERLARYHIIIHDVALTNLVFSDKFTHAVEAKQVEEQNIKQQEYKKQQAEQNAAAAVATAHGLADSNLAIATAEAQGNLIKAKATADGNRMIRESLTGDVIRYRAIQQWDGVLPQLMMGGGSVPFINLDMKHKNAATPTSGHEAVMEEAQR